jgi:hypothetical protein
VKALQDPACNAVVTGPTPPALGAGRQDARHVAKYTVFADSNAPAFIFLDNGYLSMPIAVPTFASSEGEGIGAGHVVTTYEAFHTLYDPGVFGRPLRRQPTQTEQQALILLHEIGHLTGATPRHFNDVPEINGRITDACFSAAGL